MDVKVPAKVGFEYFPCLVVYCDMDLQLIEKLLLLGTHDDKGTSVSDSWGSIDYSVAGAVLFELNHSNHIQIKGKEVVVDREASTENPYFQLALEKLQKDKKTRDMQHWVSTIAGIAPKVRASVLEGLAEKGILEKKDHHYVWIFHSERYPTANPEPELKIRQRLEKILEGSIQMQEDDFVLLSLVKSANLIKEVFGSDNLKETKKKVESICENEPFGSAISKVIEEIQTAITIILVTTTVVTVVN
jgi:hypothetical protein